jgi:DNA-binding NtrC family response regulator
MFDLRRLVHMGRSTRQRAAEHIQRTPSASEPVQLVAIIQNSYDSETLRQLAAIYGWRISIVRSSDAAIPLLKEQPIPLVICDRDLPGEAWQDVLAKVAAQPQAVCVLLASSVMDDYLWNQVIRHNGYDVVAKPFQPDELRRAVTFAWSWRGWAHRYPAGVLRKPTT